MTDLPKAILAQEEARGRALVAKDGAALRALIHPDLVHIHATGQIEDHDGYFHTVENVLDFLKVERGPLTVTPIGETAAISHGRLLQTVVHRPSGATMQLDATASQLWLLEGGHWRQKHFQASTDLRN